MEKKEFTMERRDGTEAKFEFVKPEGSVWYWNVLLETRGETASIPLPDVDLGEAKTLKDCLDLIKVMRGENWVGRVVADILQPGLYEKRRVLPKSQRKNLAKYFLMLKKISQEERFDTSIQGDINRIHQN